MKSTIILFFIFFLFSCFWNNQTKQENNQNIISTTGSHISEITTNQTGVTLLSGSIFTSTQTVIIATGKTTPKELEFHITPAPQEESWLQNSDDASITKYVNDKIHYTKINYVPDDLETISGKYILDVKWNQTLRKEANLYLQELSKAFYNEFQVKLKIVSAYRSYNYQVGIKQRGCSDLFCAKPWYSEHQSGLAFDMFETTSKDEFLWKKNLKEYFEWMEENAHVYGFHNSYQKGKEIDGYVIEPWHWRYLWVDFSTELQEKKMTYWEYYKLHWQK